MKRFQRAEKLADIPIAFLQSAGIGGIILDLDNTVVSEDDRLLSPGAEAWLRRARDAGLAFFILSNGRRAQRFQYWSQRLNIEGIYHAKKPSPRVFRRAIALLGLQPAQVLVVGDSWHTDVLGARLAGCACIQVCSLPHPARWWEPWLGRWVHRPYPRPQELVAVVASELID